MTAQLRVVLPPLETLHAEVAVAYLLIDRQGRIEAEGEAVAAQLARLAKGRALMALLHPRDAVLTTLALPPLPEARLGAAVQCAALGLVLGDIKALHIAHGPRGVDGQVAVAWVGREKLQHLGRWLQASALKLRGLHALEPCGSRPCRRCQHREVAGTASMLSPAGPAPTACAVGQPLPAWGLQGGLTQAASSPRGWGRALACCAVAVFIWTLGLNLYAARLANEGQQLRQQMNAQVRQAFPQLPVVLNPLQQARQQLQAGHAADDPGNTFNRLLAEAGQAMPFLAGAISQLDYANGILELKPLSGAAKPTAQGSWLTDLGNKGIQASATAEGWTLRLVLPGQPTESEEVAGVE
ncbi:type II secretion system protein GspL [Pseudomonas fontis]|uniref:Type II secretion system protein GspL n=1 Tax=Pseudomonas fontis TaxID=2942633 RepID=A0ABT5NPV1_9PSED|nr:type II secretion system protein GspL [Pseudomonas fontis]MDD0974710.1 type II secretion system protein GspL [Pseudomonas fontis]MDD0990205.1 type II secretion system protein GspL [Pseudomonas fontis]